MEKRHRIFIAINLPGDIKKQLFLYSKKWPELPAKWTAKDNLHITLEFLGDLTDIEIADVCKAVSDVAKQHKSFSINLNKILYGPPKKNPPRPPKFLEKNNSDEVDESLEEDSSKIEKFWRPRFVWVEGEKSKELNDLKNDLQELLMEKVKFRPDGKGFVTHITLARISEWEFRKFELDERPEINENIDLAFTVESIEVMESELKKSGPVYTILESHQLGE